MSKPIEGRFFSKVNKDGPIIRPELTKCWQWTGAKDRAGYGQILRSYPPIKWARAHRVSMEIHLGRLIPSKEFVLHKCDNPLCVNPEHLYIGTHIDNMKDMKQRKRRSGKGGSKGESHPASKLTNDVVIEMRRLRSQGLSFTKIGQIFNIHKSTSARACGGGTWNHLVEKGGGAGHEVSG